MSHASIIDGVMLAQGMHPDLEVHGFGHDKPSSLERALGTAENKKKLVVVEGLYSVDGAGQKALGWVCGRMNPNEAR